ncbi:MAG: YfhO family protein [Pirellulales bacterium]|nr:YfhO family protein [Pirellulales bacterium]
MPPSRLRPSGELLCALTLVGLSVLWLLGQQLCGAQVPTFRDVAHFYTPVFALCRDEWAAGRVPLWNPYENLGQPLAADGTSSVFYPLKLLWVLPINNDVALAWYLAAHLLLACATMFAAARAWGARRTGAALAGVAYALCGQVLFQVTNVVFLVGSAWLPAALLYGIRAARDARPGDPVKAGLVWALLVLGGEPQSAYHAGLAWLLACGWGGRRSVTRYRGLLRVGGAIGLGVALAAIQIVPTAELYRLSTRAALDGVHERLVELFAIPPARYLELLWPNLGGTLYPMNARWWNALPGGSRQWTYSLYLGTIPLAAAASTLASARRRPAVVVLALVAVATAALACGSAGGYGILQHGLPGYGGFRYPGKLFLVSSVALAALAALGADAWRRAPRRAWISLALLTSVSLVALGLCIPLWARLLVTFDAPPDLLFGPLNPGAALADLRWGFVQTAIVAALGAAIWTWAQRRPDGHGWRKAARSVRWAFRALVAATALELTVAHGWMLTATPAADRPRETIVDQLRTLRPGPECLRVYRAPLWLPDAWQRSSSAQRVVEAWRWDQQTTFPRYPLTDRVGILRVPGSFQLADYRQFWAEFIEPTLGALHQGGKTPGAGLDLLAADAYILPSNARTPTASRDPGLDRVRASLEPRGVHTADTAVWLSPDRPPRAWVTHRWQSLEEFRLHFPPSLRPFANLRERPIVELSHEELAEGPDTDVAAGERCEITRHEPERVVCEVRLAAPGLLVLADQFYPGWQARVRTAPAAQFTAAPIARANQVMRGVFLPAGQHQVEFIYRPTSCYLGAGVTAATLIALGGWLAARALYFTATATRQSA